MALAELAAVASKLGHIPTVAESFDAIGIVSKDGAALYKYLNFNQIERGSMIESYPERIASLPVSCFIRPAGRPINTSKLKVLRRPVECALAAPVGVKDHAFLWRTPEPRHSQCIRHQ